MQTAYLARKPEDAVSRSQPALKIGSGSVKYPHVGLGVGLWYLAPSAADFGEVEAFDECCTFPASCAFLLKTTKALVQASELGGCHFRLVGLRNRNDFSPNVIELGVVVDSKLLLELRKGLELCRDCRQAFFAMLNGVSAETSMGEPPAKTSY
jgi:hypothetical protein